MLGRDGSVLAFETIVRHRIAPGIHWNASRTLPYFARNGQNPKNPGKSRNYPYSCLLALKDRCLGSSTRVMLHSHVGLGGDAPQLLGASEGELPQELSQLFRQLS